MAKQLNENAGCLSIFMPFLEKLNLVQDTGNKKKPLPYRVRDDFLSAPELSFYKVMENLLGTRLTIQSKVRMADIFFVIRPKENHRSYFPRISQKHLDFLVCDSKTMQPVFGVELDDSSHLSAKRQKRDRFVDEVFAAAKLPLLHVPTQRQYNSREIADQIRPLLKDYIQANAPQPTPTQTKMTPTATAAPTPKVIPVPTPNSDNTPLCPKCGTPMVVRTVSKGDHKGKQFYGCSNYPKCRQMKPIEQRSS
jgi:hypothetical protein